jgi:hypothetical protein
VCNEGEKEKREQEKYFKKITSAYRGPNVLSFLPFYS